jgi:putative nucleotidyltransferase with HDIG domain
MREKIPSRKECLELLKKYRVPKNIVGHSMLVAKIALYLGRRLSAAGDRINLPLLEAAALLHDIDKKICIDDDTKKHAEEAAVILEREGLLEIAGIVKEHRLRHILEAPFSSLESKLVYYADKRVNPWGIASLDERYEYLLRNYGKTSKRIKSEILKTKPMVLALEKDIFSKIGVNKELGGLDE